MASSDEVEAVEEVMARMQVLAASDDVMTARAAARVTVILGELLVEISPTAYQGPWQFRTGIVGASR